MPMDTRELFARLIQCEAGGEGEDGMKAIATVVMNRATIDYGEFARVSNGGDARTPSRMTRPRSKLASSSRSSAAPASRREA